MAEIENKTNWKEALRKLKDGNGRFVNGVRSTESLMGHARLPYLAKYGQKPFAIVLSCSDSRVPAEHVFDCGFGDLFVIRVAGNIVQPSQIASIEYAVHALGCRLLLIMGHTKCGAVQAALDHVTKNAPMPTKNIDMLIRLISPSVIKTVTENNAASHDELLTSCIHENVLSVKEEILRESPLIRDLELNGSVHIERSVFDIETGQVHFASKIQLRPETSSPSSFYREASTITA